jgi:hypothetical protein
MTDRSKLIDTALERILNEPIGKRYAAAEVKEIVYPLTQELRAIDADRVFVHVVDLKTDNKISSAESFAEGVALAWGFLLGIKATLNDDNQILVLDQKARTYRIVVAGAIVEEGDDWTRRGLERAVRAAQGDLNTALEEMHEYDRECEGRGRCAQ